MDELHVVFLYEAFSDTRPTEIWEHFSKLSDPFETGEEPNYDFANVSKGDVTGMFVSNDEQNGDGFAVPEMPHVRLDVQERTFDVEESAELETRIEDLVAVIQEIYTATDSQPSFIYAFPNALNEVAIDHGTPPASAETLRDGRINYVDGLLCSRRASWRRMAGRSYCRHQRGRQKSGTTALSYSLRSRTRFFWRIWPPSTSISVSKQQYDKSSFS